MSQNTGTLIIATTRPNDILDNYPTLISNETKGGLHIYNNYSDLANIPINLKQQGMLANVINDTNSNLNDVFVLDSSLLKWSYLNSITVIPHQIDIFDANQTNNLILFLSCPYYFEVNNSSISTFNIRTSNANVNVTLLENNNSLNSNVIGKGSVLHLNVNSTKINSTLPAYVAIQVSLIRVKPTI